MKHAVLVSGGIDSTIMLAHAYNEYGPDSVVGVFGDYGQANLEVTLRAATYQADKYGVPLRTMKLPYQYSKASILDRQQVLEGITKENVYKKDVKGLSWVPARNALFLLTAGGLISEQGGGTVLASFQFDECEWEVYDKLDDKSKFGGSDLTPAFLERMNAVAPYCYKTDVQFHAPFIDKRMDVFAITAYGRELGCDLEQTYSCRYWINNGPCGQCEQCVIRDMRLAATVSNG